MKSASKTASTKKILAFPVLSLMILAGLGGNAVAQTGGIGTPSYSNPTAPEVVPNPVNPNSGRSTFSDSNSSTRTPGSRPFPESSRIGTRSSEFYRPARPGIVGSDANEGERPAYVPPVAPNRAATGTSSGVSNSTPRQQAPQTQAPQTAPNININSDTREQPTINIILPTASPEPVSDSEDPLGRDRVYQDVIVNDRDDSDDADASEVPLWAVWSGLAVLLAAFASFATWWVIKRRNEQRFGEY